MFVGFGNAPSRFGATRTLSPYPGYVGIFFAAREYFSVPGWDSFSAEVFYYFCPYFIYLFQSRSKSSRHP